jgi:hypothetical protein
MTGQPTPVDSSLLRWARQYRVVRGKHPAFVGTFLQRDSRYIELMVVTASEEFEAGEKVSVFVDSASFYEV